MADKLDIFQRRMININGDLRERVIYQRHMADDIFQAASGVITEALEAVASGILADEFILAAPAAGVPNPHYIYDLDKDVVPDASGSHNVGTAQKPWASGCFDTLYAKHIPFGTRLGEPDLGPYWNIGYIESGGSYWPILEGHSTDATFPDIGMVRDGLMIYAGGGSLAAGVGFTDGTDIMIMTPDFNSTPSSVHLTGGFSIHTFGGFKTGLTLDGGLLSGAGSVGNGVRIDALTKRQGGFFGTLFHPAYIDWVMTDNGEFTAAGALTLSTAKDAGDPVEQVRIDPSGLNLNACDLMVNRNTHIDASGFFRPISSSDANAPNNSIYYSTTASRLVYKDSVGAVNNLY